MVLMNMVVVMVVMVAVILWRLDTISESNRGWKDVNQIVALVSHVLFPLRKSEILSFQATYTTGCIFALKITTELQTETKIYRFKSLPPCIGGMDFIVNKI